jgi:hypothetical protein
MVKILKILKIRLNIDKPNVLGYKIENILKAEE